MQGLYCTYNMIHDKTTVLSWNFFIVRLSEINASTALPGIGGNVSAKAEEKPKNASVTVSSYFSITFVQTVSPVKQCSAFH